MTTGDTWVELPGRVVGPSLTAAGLAAWVLSKNDRVEEAAATGELQDALNAALRSGTVGATRVSRDTVERAGVAVETAATLLETWSESAGGDDQTDTEAVRLRVRISSLRPALEAD